MRTIVPVMMLVAFGGCSTVVASAPARPNNAIAVEVWTGGDDGLTQRLTNSVRNEFRQSAHFILAPASTPNSLRVTIPTHVNWEEVGDRMRVTYRVVFDTAEGRMGERSGVCWDDDLRACARMVVEQATEVAFR
jgi:hypothetical protein